MSDTAFAVDAGLDLEAGSVLLAELCEQVHAAESALARAVVAAGRLAGAGVAERIERLPLDLVLATACRLTGSDAGSLITAGETLQTLPQVQALFLDGQLSWGQVRRIVFSARKVPVARRAELDERIAATCVEHGGFDAFNPDDLCDQVDVACAELRDPRSVERAEQRRARGEFVSLQSDFDGGLAIYANLGPVSGAIFLNALTAQLHALDAATDGDGTADGDDPDTDGEGVPGSVGAGDGDGDGDDAEVGVWSGRDRGRRQAQALVALAAASLSGMFGDGRPRPAKPLFSVVVDPRQVTRTAAGTIRLDVPGVLPTLTARLVEQLSTDATLQAVIFDGHRPLAVGAKLHAQDIPSDVRVAVHTRDRGSRFPGSRQPVGRSHVHHLVHREHGGTNDVNNLVTVGAHEHLTGIHKRGWQGRFDPDTGIVEWTNRDRPGRTLRTLPRGTPLSRPQPRGDPPAPGGDPPQPGDPPTGGGDPPQPGDPPTGGGDPPQPGDPPGSSGADPPLGEDLFDPTPPGMPF
jgi:hypothetical protein